MNTHKPRRHLAAALAVVATSVAFAQATSSDLETRQDQDQTVKLEAFQVHGSPDVGYGAQFASSSSRLNMRYIDIPQSVDVVTAQLMKDAFVFDSQEVTKLVPGVEARANTHQPGTFYVRGLQITNTYVDGYLAPRAVNRDVALYDRIEYVQGPASAAMGRGEAGGLVNYVSKVPYSTPRDAFDVTIGSAAFYRFTADHNQPVTSDGRIAFRVPVYFQDADNPRGGHLMHMRSYGIGPAFVWKIGPKSTLNINTAYSYFQSPGQVGEAYWQNDQWYRVQVDLGQVNPANNWMPGRDPYIPVTRVFGYPGRGRESWVYTAEGIFTQKIFDSLTFRQGLSYNHIDENLRRWALSPTAVPNAAVPGDFLVAPTFLHDLYHINSFLAQGDLLYDTRIANTRQQFLAGYEISRGSQDFKEGSRSGPSQSLYNPDYTLPAGFDPSTYVLSYSSNNYTRRFGFGYFYQYNGSFFNDHIQVLYGWRKDRTGTELWNRRAANVYSNPPDLSTSVPRYSISYKPTQSVTIYYLHTEQADPLSIVNKYTNILPSAGAVPWAADDPRRSELISSAVHARLNELGVKASLLDGRVTGSFAMFALNRDGFILNAFKSEPSSNGVGSVAYNENYIANGEQVRGYEVSLFGQLARRLTFNAYVSSMNGSKLGADGVHHYPIEALIPSASINLKYDFRNAQHNGFAITGGGKYMFKGWNMQPGTYISFNADQYYVDGGVEYSWHGGRYTVTARCNNITNQFNFISGNSQLPLRRAFLAFSGAY